MRLGRTLIAIGLAGMMGFGLYTLYKEKVNWSKEVQKLNQDLTAIQKENQSLQARLDYFKEPQNLLKELKSQFNYKQSGEKLIIIVPGTGIASSTTP